MCYGSFDFFSSALLCYVLTVICTLGYCSLTSWLCATETCACLVLKAEKWGIPHIDATSSAVVFDKLINIGQGCLYGYQCIKYWDRFSCNSDQTINLDVCYHLFLICVKWSTATIFVGRRVQVKSHAYIKTEDGRMAWKAVHRGMFYWSIYYKS